MLPSLVASDLTKSATDNTVATHKIAAASLFIEKQAGLIRELHSAHLESAKTAAALVQAVKLAQDGVIDVTDVLTHAKELVKSGTVRLASADDLFNVSPGELIEGQTEAQSQAGPKLDSLTSYLRSLH